MSSESFSIDPMPDAVEARLVKDIRGFRIGFYPSYNGMWKWKSIQAKTWRAARWKAPTALSELLEENAAELSRRAAHIESIAKEQRRCADLARAGVDGKGGAR